MDPSDCTQRVSKALQGSPRGGEAVNVRLTVAVCILIASAVVFLVSWFVRSQNRRLAGAEGNARRWKVQASKAEDQAVQARQQAAYSTRVASDALTRTGQALDVAQGYQAVSRKVDQVAGQMDVLMGLVLGEHTTPSQVPRHRRSLPAEGQPAIPEIDHLPNRGTDEPRVSLVTKGRGALCMSMQPELEWRAAYGCHGRGQCQLSP